MRFPWSRPKTDKRQSVPQDTRHVLDAGTAAFFNNVAPQKSALGNLAPRKDTSRLWPQAASRHADSAEQMAERRIRQWMMEQEAEERQRFKIKKP